MLYQHGLLATESQGNGFFQYQFTIDHEGDIVLQHWAKNVWRDVYAFEPNKSYSEEEYVCVTPHVNQGIARNDKPLHSPASPLPPNHHEIDENNTVQQIVQFLFP